MKQKTKISIYSLIGRLRRPLARPLGVGGIKVVGFIKMHWDRHLGQTSGTDTHVGQTHIWDRLTYGTDSHTYGTDSHF